MTVIDVRTVLRRLLIWTGCGASVGFLMALTEYVYLTTTVEQFADGSETLVFGAGLLGAFSVLGALLGLMVHGVFSPLQLLFQRVQWLGRLQEVFTRRWLVITIAGLCGVGFLVGFLVNALAYHRLYVGYHALVSGLTFVTGLVGVQAVRFLLPTVPEKEQRKVRWAAGIAAGLVLLCAVLASPRLVTNENLRAIVADRGVVSGQLFVLVRSLADRDGDGFAAPPLGYDCDDGDPRRHPMRYDAPGNGRDEDCTGADRQPPKPLPGPPARVQGPQRILVFTIDAVRADRWPARYRRNVLPNIYRLSKQGAYFTRAYATSNWTIPSVHSLHTGRWPSHVPFVKAALDHQDRVYLADPDSRFARDPKNLLKLIPVPAHDRSPTLAGELAKRGYVTATVLGSPFLKPEMGMARGFGIVDQTPYRRAKRPWKGVTAPAMVRQALRIIRKHARERLFFYMHLNDPHEPYHRHGRGGDLGSSAADRYDSELRFVDQWLGVLFGALQLEGLLQGSLIVITSDHGEEFGEHGGRYHGSTVFEEQIHVPLVLVGPGIRPAVHPWVVSHVDLLPTLLAFTDGVEARHLRAGMDLTPLLKHGRVEDRLQRRAIYAESRSFQNWKQALVNLRFKLVRDCKAGATVLYDLQNDRRETRNVRSRRRTLARFWLGYLNRLLDHGG